MKNRKTLFTLLLILSAALLVLAVPALGDGTETLGPPSITVAAGDEIAAAGTGLETQPGTINLDVPGAINQTLLYWLGETVDGSAPDDTLVVDGTVITGTLIGGPINYGFGRSFYAYRADITSTGLVNQGANSLTVTGMEFAGENSGAGIMVFYQDITNPGGVTLYDGADFAYHSFAPPLDATTPQFFEFPATTCERTADLYLMVGSVADTPEVHRPDSIEVTVDGTTTVYSDQLESRDGPLWDTLHLTATLPAGSTSLGVQIFSRDDLNSGADPASLVWVAAATDIPPTCSTGASPPIIELKKYISIDGGQSWADANAPGMPGDDTPSVEVPTDVEYKMVISNTADASVLTGVVMSDSVLGLFNFPVGDIGPNEQRTITSADAPELSLSQICALNNTANASGGWIEDPTDVFRAEDPANLTENCTVAPQTIYQTDFDNVESLGPEWTYSSGTPELTVAPGGQSFLGRFGNETVSLTVNDIPRFCAATRVTVNYDLYVIKTWDGNTVIQPGTNEVVGPDLYHVNVENGPNLMDTNFANWKVYRGVIFSQAYPNFLDRTSHPSRTDSDTSIDLGQDNACYQLLQEPPDYDLKHSVYHLQHSFMTTNTTETIDFSASGLQGVFDADPAKRWCDESWGIDNVRVEVTCAGDYNYYLPLMVGQ